MKNIGLLGILIVIAAVIGAVFVALDYGETSPIYASGTVELADELESSGVTINTLFLVLYDADSDMPMPYGAVRYKLSAPPKGQFHHFIITKETLNVMNPQRALPKNFRIKAKLDLDGNAGMDQPGDLYGELAPVAFGSKDLVISIRETAQ